MRNDYISKPRHFLLTLVFIASATACSCSLTSEPGEGVGLTANELIIRSTQDSVLVLRGTESDPAIRLNIIIENRSGRTLYMLGSREQPAFYFEVYSSGSWVTVEAISPVSFNKHLVILSGSEAAVSITVDGRFIPQYAQQNMSGKYRIRLFIVFDPDDWGRLNPRGIDEELQRSAPFYLLDSL